MYAGSLGLLNGQLNQEGVMSKLLEPFVSERLLNITVPSVYGPTADVHPLTQIEWATADA